MKTGEPVTHTQKVLNGHDHHQEFLLIKQDDKFFSRLLSKEKSSSTKGESSFRFYYYGDSSKGSIPFRWESQPGTPKHALSDTSLPPLTPPPSYQSSTEQKSCSRRSSRPRFLLPSIFAKLSSKKINCSSNNISPSLSSSSSSSSFSLSSSTPTAALSSRGHRSRSNFQLRLEEIYGDDDQREVVSASPTSTLCFGCGNGATGGSDSTSFRASRSWLCMNNINLFN